MHFLFVFWFSFIKTIIKDPTRLLKEVYDNVLEKENSVVPDYYSVKSTMYRQRATKRDRDRTWFRAFNFELGGPYHWGGGFWQSPASAHI